MKRSMVHLPDCSTGNSLRSQTSQDPTGWWETSDRLMAEFSKTVTTFVRWTRFGGRWTPIQKSFLCAIRQVPIIRLRTLQIQKGLWLLHSLHRKVKNTNISRRLEWDVQTLGQPGVEQVMLFSEMFLRSARESMTVFFKVRAKRHSHPS